MKAFVVMDGDKLITIEPSIKKVVEKCNKIKECISQPLKVYYQGSKDPVATFTKEGLIINDAYMIQGQGPTTYVVTDEPNGFSGIIGVFFDLEDAKQALRNHIAKFNVGTHPRDEIWNGIPDLTYCIYTMRGDVHKNTTIINMNLGDPLPF
jgi:hypothetical protein